MYKASFQKLANHFLSVCHVFFVYFYTNKKTKHDESLAFSTIVFCYLLDKNILEGFFTLEVVD